MWYDHHVHDHDAHDKRQSYFFHQMREMTLTNHGHDLAVILKLDLLKGKLLQQHCGATQDDSHVLGDDHRARQWREDRHRW